MENTLSTQMNVRIDAQLKTLGDEALASIGFTPTRAIRALWNCAAQRGEQLQMVEQFLTNAESGNRQARTKSAILCEGRQIVPSRIASLGISASALAQATCDETALIEEAREERAEQKGWL